MSFPTSQLFTDPNHDAAGAPLTFYRAGASLWVREAGSASHAPFSELVVTDQSLYGPGFAGYQLAFEDVRLQPNGGARPGGLVLCMPEAALVQYDGEDEPRSFTLQPAPQDGQFTFVSLRELDYRQIPAMVFAVSDKRSGELLYCSAWTHGLKRVDGQPAVVDRIFHLTNATSTHPTIREIPNPGPEPLVVLSGSGAGLPSRYCTAEDGELCLPRDCADADSYWRRPDGSTVDLLRLPLCTVTVVHAADGSLVSLTGLS